MGPSNDKIKSLVKPTALDAIDWLDEHEDAKGFHFKICEPRIDADSEYHDDLVFYLAKISRLVALDEFSIEAEDSTRIVKVRLRLSAVAVQQNMTLEVAIRTLCKSMMTTGTEGKQLFVENLTPRSIWGIIPLSDIFRAYWTASFFNKILSEGPRVFSSLAEDIIRESRPYLNPTFMVFAFAALAGLHDCFHLMQHFYNLDLAETFDLPNFIQRVLPTVGVQRTSAGESLREEKEKFDFCIQHFVQTYDEVLNRFGTVQSPTGHMSLRDMGWMHFVCNSLCKMSNAASSVLVLREDLLHEVMSASIQKQNDAVKGGIVALGSLWLSLSSVTVSATTGSAAAAAVAGTLIVPVIASGVAFSSAKWAWDSYRKKRELVSERGRFKTVFSITTVTWTTAYHIRLALEWFRLHEGDDPSALQFPDPEFQRMWQSFVDSYHAVTHPQNVGSVSVEQLLSIWIDEQVRLLREQRQTLTTTLRA
ncbi:hypothetical protein NOF04DRAFT_1165860 [Fusarium oxysporum II5]|nr:hypothetical protein NOF04DRAFT_1165860 [Fusarium oxysporum II5]